MYATLTFKVSPERSQGVALALPTSTTQREMMQSLTFFNNKGGVGKTTLTCNLASYFATEFNLKVLVVDGDPQCNTTQLILGEDICNELYWPDKSRTGSTIADVVQPLTEGDIAVDTSHSPFKSEDNRFNVDLIPGDPTMSIVEDLLGKWWSYGGGGDLGALRKTNCVSMLLREYEKYDLVIFDVGPSLGSLNRSILLATDYFASPLAADTFSIVALRNIKQWFRQWRENYSYQIESVSRLFGDKIANHSIELNVDSKFRFIGYTVQQYITRTRQGERRPTAAYEALLSQIPVEISQTLADLKPDTLDYDSLRLGDVPNLYSLIPLAQDVNAPIARLSSKDGIAGGQYPQQREYRALIEEVGASLAWNLGLGSENKKGE